jgi:hypothetical protein
VDLVQLVPEALHVQVVHLGLPELVELLVLVDLLPVLVEHPVVLQVELLHLVLLVVVQVLVVAVAAVAQPVLLVRVDHVALQRLESLRE